MPAGFLTIEQVCEQLGVTADDVKAMVAEGRLGEIRDGGKIFYREDDVSRLAAKEGSSVVDLAVTEQPATDAGQIDETDSFASALSSLADSSSSGISLLEDSGAGVSPIDEPAELNVADIPDELPAAPPTGELSSEIGLLSDDDSGGEASLKSADDLPDLGLSGSDVIRLETADDAKKKAKEDTRITSAGISVFDDDELDIEADPMEKTHVASAVEDFDAVGSGSGLLDLTRESDDTSLGQILDVISPSEGAETEAEAIVDDDAVLADDSAAMAGAAARDAFNAPVAGTAARRAVSATPGAVPLNICLLLGILAMALIGLVTAGQIQGIWPATIVAPISKDVVHWAVFGGLFAAVLGTGIAGLLAGRK